MSDSTKPEQPKEPGSPTPGQTAEADATAPTPSASEQEPATAAPPPGRGKNGLALAALVVGIVAIVFASIPVLSFIAFLPAFAAVGLGIGALVGKNKTRRGQSIAGLVLGGVAFFVAIGVSVGFVASLSSQQNMANPAAPADGTDEPVTATEAEEGPGEPEATEAAEPAEPVVIPDDMSYSGSGDDILAIELPDGEDTVGFATFTHDGDSNFAIWSLDADMEQQELLVNTIGGYQGTVIFDTRVSESTDAFEITADGAWTVTLHSIHSLREFDGASATGSGDDVLIYRGSAGPAELTHNGGGNFAIWFYGNDTDLVVNEIGAYSGTVRWGAGPAVVAVSADGDWTIEVQ